MKVITATINGYTREIELSQHFLGSKSDHNVDRVVFTCPRFVADDIDLMQNALRVNYINSKRQKGLYIIDDIELLDNDLITFSWLISRNVTIREGEVSFSIEAITTNDASEVITEWNTKTAISYVKPSIESNTGVFKVDAIDQIIRHVEGVRDEVNDSKNNVLNVYDEIKLKALNIRKITDYTYSIDIGKINYDAAYEFFKEKYKPISAGSCAVVRKGDFFGRNYDWTYDETATFIVRTAKGEDRHASIGVMGSIGAITASFVDSGEYSELYEILPFYMQDGINDAGVVCNINVVPTGDKGITEGTNTSSEINLCTVMLVRYVLDYADSAEHAIQLLEQCNIYAPQSESFSQETHFMIADANETYVVEFVNNEMVVISEMPNDASIMTNFYLDGFDGETTTGFYQDGGISPEETTLTAHAAGIERYDILLSGYGSVDTSEKMVQLMQSVYYTNAYLPEIDPYWYSEFTGGTETFGDMTIYQNGSEYEGVVAYTQEQFAQRQRDGKTWCTVHMAVYNIEDLSFKLYMNESDSLTAEFFLDSVATAEKYASESKESLLSVIENAQMAQESANTAVLNAGLAIESVAEAQRQVAIAVEKAQEIIESSQDIIDLTVSVHLLEPGSEPTVTKTGGSGSPYNLDFGLAKAEITSEEMNEIAALTSQLITKDSIGLGNVDNTSDLNKPISIAMQEALDNKIEVVKVNNIPLPIADGAVNIDLSSYLTEDDKDELAESLLPYLPKATSTTFGLVKADSSTISVDDDGIISVQSMDVSKLYVADGDELVLDCGESN